MNVMSHCETIGCDVCNMHFMHDVVYILHDSYTLGDVTFVSKKTNFDVTYILLDFKNNTFYDFMYTLWYKIL